MFWLLLNLKVAYSTELGASTAYRGHANATKDARLSAYIRGIERDELHHRAVVGELLQSFDAKPWTWLESLFWFVGTVVGGGCYVWGGWAAAFGAAQFELGGIGDYKRAAAAARKLDKHELGDLLDELERQEQDHRRFFMDVARSRPPLGIGGRVPLDMAAHPTIRPADTATMQVRQA